MESVIASFGGVGTSFLLSYLAQYKKTNSPIDADGFKHLPVPPVSFNGKTKFVYVYGNPQQAAISLFRRNFHYPQSLKLQRWGKETISPIPQEMTLREYASQGIDKFCFRNHFYNWYDKYLAACPTMFIRYETIFDNVEPLLDFLDLPNSCIDSFPKKKKRASTLEEIPVETLKHLDHIYGDFSDELAKLDDVEIRKRANHRIFSMTYLKSPYRKAFSIELKLLLKNHTSKIYTMLRKIKQLTNRST